MPVTLLAMSSADLRALRDVLGLTQAELAERIGMHPNSVSRMERGELAISARTAAVVRLLVSR